MGDPKPISAISVPLKGQLARRNTALEWETFAKAIARLEAAKNQNFSAETIRVWFSEFQAMGFSNEDVIQAASNVMRAETYGAVGFHHFMQATRMYSEAEVRELIAAAIAGKLKSFGSMDEVALAREALREAESRMFTDVERFKTECRDRALERVEKVKRWFTAADEITQRRVMQRVAERNPIQAADPLFQPHWREFTRLLIHTVVDEFESEAQ